MKNIPAIICAAALFLAALPVQATIILSIIPASQNTTVSSTVNAALVISGLGSGAAPSLGTFDVDVSFNSAILGLNNVVFGDPALGDQLDILGLGSLFISTPGAGMVNLFELSFDLSSDLDSFQAESFTLATLNFDALSAGTSSLAISINALGDALGVTMVADSRNGSVTPADLSNNPTPTVPEPSSLLLITIGILGMIALAQRHRSQLAARSIG